MASPKILVFASSTRAGSYNAKLAALAAKELTLIDADVTRISLVDYELPIYDPDLDARVGQPANALRLKQMISAHHGVFIASAEYTASVTPALKNAIDFLYAEWVNKAAGFIGYGGASGARAVENLRLIMAELQVATVRAQVGLSMFTDFENFSVFKPAANQEKYVHVMLDQLIAWASALKALREKQGLSS